MIKKKAEKQCIESSEMVHGADKEKRSFQNNGFKHKHQEKRKGLCCTLSTNFLEDVSVKDGYRSLCIPRTLQKKDMSVQAKCECNTLGKI